MTSAAVPSVARPSRPRVEHDERGLHGCEHGRGPAPRGRHRLVLTVLAVLAIPTLCSPSTWRSAAPRHGYRPPSKRSAPGWPPGHRRERSAVRRRMAAGVAAAHLLVGAVARRRPRRHVTDGNVADDSFPTVLGRLSDRRPPRRRRRPHDRARSPRPLAAGAGSASTDWSSQCRCSTSVWTLHIGSSYAAADLDAGPRAVLLIHLGLDAGVLLAAAVGVLLRPPATSAWRPRWPPPATSPWRRSRRRLPRPGAGPTSFRPRRRGGASPGPPACCSSPPPASSRARRTRPADGGSIRATRPHHLRLVVVRLRAVRRGVRGERRPGRSARHGGPHHLRVACCWQLAVALCVFSRFADPARQPRC